jgi:hypothetical protein
LWPVVGETTEELNAGEAATREAWPPGDAPEPTRLQSTYTAPPARQVPPTTADHGAYRRPSGRAGPPSGAAVAKPRRRRRAHVNLPRLIVPIVFLAAVIAVHPLACAPDGTFSARL